MTLWHIPLLLVAGCAAGVASVLVSLASLVSYPALLLVGLAPVAANVTNTVALVGTGLGAAAGSRAELAGTRSVLLRYGAIAMCGGATGAALLLLAPAETFQRVVPFLIGGASIFLLIQPQLGGGRRARLGGHRAPRERTRRHAVLFGFAFLLAAVYAGYFGAAGGILSLAILSAAHPEWDVHRANAVKNVVSTCSNGSAAIGFALFGPVHWGAALPLAVGFLVGGRIGPSLARRLPGHALRVAAAGCGIAMAVTFAW